MSAYHRPIEKPAPVEITDLEKKYKYVWIYPFGIRFYTNRRINVIQRLYMKFRYNIQVKSL